MDVMQGLLLQRLVDLTGRHPSTVRRWIRQNRFPPWVERLEHFRSDLGQVAPAWSGWSLHRDKIRSPEGLLLTPTDLRAVPVLHGQIRAYQDQSVTHLQADWVDRRYVESVAAASAAGG